MRLWLHVCRSQDEMYRVRFTALHGLGAWPSVVHWKIVYCPAILWACETCSGQLANDQSPHFQAGRRMSHLTSHMVKPHDLMDRAANTEETSHQQVMPVLTRKMDDQALWKLSCRRFWRNFQIAYVVPKINMAPENRPLEVWRWTELGNHHCFGSILVFGGGGVKLVNCWHLLGVSTL